MARVYRKKPVTVEAVQWTGENRAEMCEFIDPEVFEIIPRVGLVIHTLEGDHHASPGDYIIKGVNGEFYPCKPDIFAKTYEAVFPTLTPPNEWVTLEIVAEILAEHFGDECACNFNGNDEWLPEVCQYENTCPNPPERLGCWMEFLRHKYRRPPEGER